MLAAYDIQQAFGFRSLRVYTFGSPRVGNHPFASEYNDTVPNTWTVINDKVCSLTKHSGKVDFGTLYASMLDTERVGGLFAACADRLLHTQDIVPTMPKFKVKALLIRFSLFKRTGLRVHLSEDELLVVRPSLMEARLGVVFSCADFCLEHYHLSTPLYVGCEI